MSNVVTVIVALALTTTIAGIPTFEDVDRTTADRIEEHNYPVEVHEVHTPDGYILTVYRIPFSPKSKNYEDHRPAVFLQHGFLSSSDGWILNGPSDALAYLLADAGYDVWLGNTRGSTYSKHHESLSPTKSSFWNFNWNEIALYDVSATIDYILDKTGERAVHYVGHSMGTTVFFILMSLRPEYNEKIKTAHMLAPIAFRLHVRAFISKLLGPQLGYKSPVSDLVTNTEFLPHNTPAAWFGAVYCSKPSPFEPLCTNGLFLIFGWYSMHFNTTLLPDFYETHPAGTSTNVYLHFEQQYGSGHFRWYDYGPVENLRKYNQVSPPDYDVSKVVAPVWLYYSDNDYLADLADVKKIEGLLPNVVESFHVPYPDWNHIDFLFARNVKETIYDKVISAASRFEKNRKS